MKRQAVGILLAVGLLAAATAAFVAARANRHKALLAALPPIPLDEFNRSAQILISQTLEQLKKEPLRADRWGELGYVLAANGVLTEPGPCFARAEELDPNDYRWPHLLGVTMIKRDRAVAIAAFKRTLKVQPNIIPTLGALAEMYLEDGSNAEADALLRPLITDKTTDPHLLWLMARIEADAESVDRALELAKRAATVPPHRRPVHTLLSQLYQRKGDAVDAHKEARLLELLPPAEEEAPWPDQIRSQVYKYSRMVDVVTGQARATISSGEHSEALRLLEELAPEDRNTPAVRAAMAMAKAHLGEFKAAEELLDGSPDPSDPNVVFSRGILALVQQKYADAADQFLKVSTLRKAHEGVRQLDGIQYNRAVCLLALKKDDEAISAFEAALKLNPGNYASLLKLADLYLQKNRKADAVRVLADAALLDPTDERVKELQKRAAG